MQTIEEILDVLILFDNQPIKHKNPKPNKATNSPIISANYNEEEDSDEDIQPEAVPNAPLTNKMTNSSKLLG